MAKHLRRKIQTSQTSKAIGTGGRKILKPNRSEVDLERLRSAKEKLKELYTLDEKELVRYAKNCVEDSKKPDQALVRQLELRLDTIVYRAGFARTHFEAQQLIKSGAVSVNQITIDDPEFHIGEKHTINVREQAQKTEAQRPWVQSEHNEIRVGKMIGVHDLLKEEKIIRKKIGAPVIDVVVFYAVI